MGDVLIDVNHKLCEFLAEERVNVIGKPFADLIGKEDREGFQFNYHRLRSNQISHFISEVSLTSHAVKEFSTRVTCEREIINEKEIIYIRVDPVNKKVAKAALIDRFSALMASVREDSMLETMVLNLTKVFGVRYAFIGIVDHITKSIDVKAFSVDNKLADNFCYNTKWTPCDDVLIKGVVAYSNNVQQKYPNDQYLIDMQIDGYVGVALKNLKGEILGNVVIMDTEPIENIDLIVSTLRIYSDRLACQLENDEQRKLLVDSNAELQKVNQELDHFIYRASHDLRSPLASVLGLVNLLRKEPAIETSLEYIDHIDHQIKKLDSFIKDIINYARVGRLHNIYEEIYFDELINEIFKSLEYHENASRIEKVVEVKMDNPFISDKGKVDVILRNLISNAIKYADVKKDQSYIRCVVESDIKFCKITIEDNGIGIAEDSLPDIFKMFYRGTEASKGSGLGLFIVQEALNKLNGEVNVESEPGSWTKFSIVLPY